jgi:hypothetical protein
VIRYTLRSKNKGKRWGIWDHEKKTWHYRPLLDSFSKSASEVANLLPQIVEMRNPPTTKKQKDTNDKSNQRPIETNTSAEQSGGAKEDVPQPTTTHKGRRRRVEAGNRKHGVTGAALDEPAS